jgi:hypothetical protein
MGKNGCAEPGVRFDPGPVTVRIGSYLLANPAVLERGNIPVGKECFFSIPKPKAALYSANFYELLVSLPDFNGGDKFGSGIPSAEFWTKYLAPNIEMLVASPPGEVAVNVEGKAVKIRVIKNALSEKPIDCARQAVTLVSSSMNKYVFGNVTTLPNATSEKFDIAMLRLSLMTAFRDAVEEVDGLGALVGGGFEMVDIGEEFAAAEQSMNVTVWNALDKVKSNVDVISSFLRSDELEAALNEPLGSSGLEKAIEDVRQLQSEMNL